MHVNGSMVRSLVKAPPPYDIYYQRYLQNTLNQNLINNLNNRSNNSSKIMSASMSCAPSDMQNNNSICQRQRIPSTSSAYSSNAIGPNNLKIQQHSKQERPQSVSSGNN